MNSVSPESKPPSATPETARFEDLYVGCETQNQIEAPPGKLAKEADAPVSDMLVRSRLGVYTGLYYALRAKHPPTAAHGLRVAIGCSKWASWRSMDETQRGILEVASLLHDVGKIGIPDRVLQKPTRLDRQEQLLMEMNYGIAAEMLRAAGAGTSVLEVIRNAREDFSTLADDASVAARMLAIVDAFDSMTIEQVFRHAVSRERAVTELFANAGTQFDPELVKEFAELIGEPRLELEAAMANRWLCELVPDPTPGFWETEVPVSCGATQNLLDTIFHRRLLNSLSDAAIYLDRDGQILLWNRAAEQLTGRQSGALIHHTWTHELMGLLQEGGQEIPPAESPLQIMLRSHTSVNARFLVRHQDGRQTKVNFTAIPVISGQKEYTGAILLARDASAQVNLEERVQSLHAIATRDPLTQVANRAELDRFLPEFLTEHMEVGQPGSLMICDIDHFKRINDNHGHQAGDEALVTFAGILSEIAREGDLVARFGGEEFVIVCSGCSNTSATSRAEEIRRAVERRPIPSLKGRTMTASFGVTEVQFGDTQETILARADRALLQAKESGRNRVVQIGPGQDANDKSACEKRNQAARQKASWLSWFSAADHPPLVETSLLASVPHDIAVKKLAGFVGDHHAEVLKADRSHVVLRIDSQKDTTSRKNDRPSVLLMDIQFKPVEFRTARASVYQSRTKLDIKIRPVRPRDRRTEGLLAQANQLLVSFSSYLVTQVIDDELRLSIIEPR